MDMRYLSRGFVPLVALIAGLAHADQAAVLLEGPTTVHRISLEFAEPQWYQVLFDAWGDDDYYLPCTFTWTDLDGVDQTLESVGARFKGNSSFLNSGTRKSMKIDFNEFVDDQEFLNLKKINLNNNYRDPSIMREKLTLDFLRDYMDIHRANYARVTINGEDWGVYMVVEQVDKTFAEKKWGSNDDGDLYKGEFIANLADQGDNPDDYRDNYEKKTNEEADDWSDIIALCQFLSDTDPEDMDTQLGEWVDIDQHITQLAGLALFANYDSYIGPAHNFYMYRRNADDLWRHINWDNNLAFGTFRNGLPNGQNVLTTALTWHREGQGPNAARPFADAVFENEVLRRRFYRRCADLLRGGFDIDAFQARIDEIDAAVRDELATDPYFEFTMEQYEQNLHSDVDIGNIDVFGLTRLIDVRGGFARAQLNGNALPSDLRINEIQTLNATTIADEAGDFDPWIEVHNLGPGTVTLSDLRLSNDAGSPLMWQLPDSDLADGEFVVLWLDGEPAEGDHHTNFAMPDVGGSLLLSDASGAMIDSITVPLLDADQSWGRHSDGEGVWEVTGEATPGAANIAPPPDLSGIVFINEFMADNETTIPDEAGEYDDWLELFNASDEEIDLSGCTMSDSFDTPDEWTMPDGTIIPAGSWLLLWADEDLDQGPLHADFKLGAGGDDIGLWSPDGVLIDSLSFGDQDEDVSFGRLPDGGAEWQSFDPATPGTSNGNIAPCPGDVDGDGVVGVEDMLACIAGWGSPDGDADGDGTTGVSDILLIISAWGESCP